MQKIVGISAGVTVVIVSICVIIILTSPNSVVHSLLSTHTASIVDATIVVPPSQQVVYTIHPISGSNNCNIHGTFSAQGGHDDIQVSITSHSNLYNLATGSNIITYFSTP